MFLQAALHKNSCEAFFLPLLALVVWARVVKNGTLLVPGTFSQSYCTLRIFISALFGLADVRRSTTLISERLVCFFGTEPS